MSKFLCCGNKKDVPPQSGNDISSIKKSEVKSSQSMGGGSKIPAQVRAVKIFGADSQVPVPGHPVGYKPITNSRSTQYLYKAKPENYGQESGIIQKSHMIGHIEELKFQLEEGQGVANTFDIPTFDYETLLRHHVFSRLNSRSKYEYEDGNA